MEAKSTRARSSSSSLSRSRSPIPNRKKRNVKTSPKQQLSTHKQDSNDEHDGKSDDHSKAIADDEISSPVMSDTAESHEKKRSSHRHHRHHKHSKSNKRSATHHRHSTKRSKKGTVSATHNKSSNDENVNSSSEKDTSESRKSQSELSNNDGDDDDEEEEEGIVKGDSTPDEHRNRHRRKKHRSPSMDEKNSECSQSSEVSVPKSNKGTQLIVNYLPSSLRESDFYQLFARVAPVKLCKLITDRFTGQSYCYGFIEYHTKEDAVKAIEKFNGYRIEHKKLKVSYAQPKSNNSLESDNEKHTNVSSTHKNPNIYITDLPDDFDEKMLERLFSKHGEIVQTKVLRDPRTKISRGVGFVLMTSTRYAERAVKALDGYIPSGSNTPISVKYADLKKTAMSSGHNGNTYSSSRLPSSSSVTPPIGPYGYPPGFPPMTMMDPYYAAAFQHHHRPAVDMRDISPSTAHSYYSSGDARSSSRMRDSSPSLPRSYSSSSSKHNLNLPRTSKLNPLSTLAAAYDLIAKGCHQAIDPNGFVIYAFGLSHECEENDLEELFQRYGEVHRVYIVRNYTTGESKGYSFVTMRNYEDACHAVDRLDGTTFQGRTIQVRFKQ